MGHQVPFDHPIDFVAVDLFVRLLRESRLRGDTQVEPRTRGARCVQHPPIAVDGGGHNIDVADGWIAVGRPIQEVVQGMEARAIGSPVGVQRKPPLHRLPPDGIEVDGDVCPAEPVDGLLGVADEDQCASGVSPTEQRREDLPLHAIGILELIDQHQLVAGPQCSHHRR